VINNPLMSGIDSKQQNSGLEANSKRVTSHLELWVLAVQTRGSTRPPKWIGRMTGSVKRAATALCDLRVAVELLYQSTWRPRRTIP
jgi:hypothetical protein